MDDSILQEVAQHRFQTFELEFCHQVGLDLPAQLAVFREFFPFTLQVVLNCSGEIAVLQVPRTALVLQPSGGQQVVDQVVHPFGVPLHQLYVLLQLLRAGPAQLDGFQMQLNRSHRRFELVGHLVDEMTLCPVERGLAPPVKKNDIDADQDGDEQQYSFGENEPVGGVGKPVGLVARGQFFQLLMATEEPVNPGNQQDNPKQLDADKGDQRVKNAAKQFHAIFYYHR